MSDLKLHPLELHGMWHAAKMQRDEDPLVWLAKAIIKNQCYREERQDRRDARRTQPEATASQQAAEPVAFVPPGYTNETDWLRQQLADAKASIKAHQSVLAATAIQQPQDAIRKLIALHAGELEGNDYAYFELARTRRTGWMAWICTNLRDDDPSRNVLATGQGETPDEACSAAVADYEARAALAKRGDKCE